MQLMVAEIGGWNITIQINGPFVRVGLGRGPPDDETERSSPGSRFSKVFGPLFDEAVKRSLIRF